MFLQGRLLGQNWGDLLDFAPISSRILAGGGGGASAGFWGDFETASLAYLSFISSTIAVVMLRARCASAAHPLPIQPFSRG
jgi:hypothetical protein